MNKKHEYDVALSFAGEDRAHAEALKSRLNEFGIRVFYDSDEKSRLWGEDLYTYLSDIYNNSARFCVMLISQHYVNKLWTVHERKAVQARVFSEQKVYLLPVRLDQTEVPGLLPTVAYLSWPPETAESIVKAIREKLQDEDDKSANLSGNIQMKPTESQQRSISSFQRRLEELYGKTNSQLSTEYIYGYLSRSLGYLCRNLAHEGASETEFIRPLSWLFALSSKIGCSVENAFISRYPDCCPHCLGLRCICRKTGKKPKQYIPAYEVKNQLLERLDTIRNSGRIISFDSGRKIIANIYPGNEVVWEFAGPWHHIAKLYEEVSEVHEALSGFIVGKTPLAALAEEVADVLAWVLGAWDIRWPERSFDDEFINYYYRGCPVCRNPKTCECRPNSSRSEGLIDPIYLMELKGDLEKLLKTIPTSRSEIEDLIRSAESALEDQNDILMRLTITQVHYKLGTIESELKDDKLNRGIVLSILESIKKVPKWLL